MVAVTCQVRTQPGKLDREPDTGFGESRKAKDQGHQQRNEA